MFLNNGFSLQVQTGRVMGGNSTRPVFHRSVRPFHVCFTPESGRNLNAR
jgi:hypothetical protein